MIQLLFTFPKLPNNVWIRTQINLHIAIGCYVSKSSNPKFPLQLLLLLFLQFLLLLLLMTCVICPVEFPHLDFAHCALQPQSMYSFVLYVSCQQVVQFGGFTSVRICCFGKKVVLCTPANEAQNVQLPVFHDVSCHWELLPRSIHSTRVGTWRCSLFVY